MRLVTYTSADQADARAARLGAVLEDGRILDLRAGYELLLLEEGALAMEAAWTASEAIPASMEAFISGGPACLAAARRALGAGSRPASEARPVAADPSEVHVLAPLQPGSIRDVVGFEDHAREGARRRGAALPDAWYERPLYYRGNHRAVLGPGEPVARPPFTRELDFELEVACIVGTQLRDAGDGQATAAIFGYTVMNDWSARDLQRAEMEGRMGPSKSKDFATSLGPCILVADAGFAGPGAPNPALPMTARVNGRTVCEANLSAAHWTFPAVLAFASQGETLHPGDVFGSGTPFGGCMLDHGGPWLEPGDVVELEVGGIGVLRTVVVQPPSA